MREEAKAVGSVGNTDALGPANLLKGAFRPSFAIGPVSEGLAGAFIRSRYDPQTYERLGKALSRIPGVWAVYFLMGDMDYVVLIRAKNRLDLNRIVYKLIAMKDIERSDTRMVMERIKEDIAVPTD